MRGKICSFVRHERIIAILLAVWILAVAGCASQEKSAEEPPRPNIVIILADDLGFSDVGSYGGEIETPNIDGLAENGLRFTQFYNTSRCVPTRASLLTGVYSHKAGLGRMTFDRGLPGYRGHLTDSVVTIAGVLGRAGYQTGMVGKWHLAVTREREDHRKWLAHQVQYDAFAPLDQYPTARGFDDFYGTIWGVSDYFDPFSLVSGTEPVHSVPEGFYYTDAISDTTIAYVEQYSRDDRPFFLYVAYQAPHWPLHAPDTAIAKYEDTYKVGWSTIRKARYRRQLEMELFTREEAPLSPRTPTSRDREWESNPDTTWDARAMAVHAAMIDRMDQGIGQIIDKLREAGELDNTLILFLSDNGASSERPSEYGPGFDRPGATREGQKIHYPVDKEVLPGRETTMTGIGPMWANVANTPFRYWKAKVHEGGITTPLIVHWPNGLEVPAGSITEQPGHVIDLMATCLDLASARYPDTFNGNEIKPLDGKSLLPIFRGETRVGHEALYWEHYGAHAVRQGTWKLVRLDTGEPWELYNLATDRTETNDLADTYPERVQQMKALWMDWAERVHVFPRPQ